MLEELEILNDMLIGLLNLEGRLQRNNGSLLIEGLRQPGINTGVILDAINQPELHQQALRLVAEQWLIMPPQHRPTPAMARADGRMSVPQNLAERRARWLLDADNLAWPLPPAFLY